MYVSDVEMRSIRAYRVAAGKCVCDMVEIRSIRRSLG